VEIRFLQYFSLLYLPTNLWTSDASDPHNVHFILGGSLGLVIMETHVLNVVSSNHGTVYRMDIFHIHICCKICNVFEKTKINEKEAWVAHF